MVAKHLRRVCEGEIGDWERRLGIGWNALVQPDIVHYFWTNPRADGLEPDIVHYVWENGRRNGAARQNSEIGRIWDRMIHPSDPVGGEGKVGRDRQKVGCPKRESR